jgi:hypothetical protein
MYLDVDGRIILRWIFNKYVMRVVDVIHVAWLTVGTSGGLL